jgi:hypothetical protein
VIVANDVAGDLVNPRRNTIHLLKVSDVAMDPYERLLEQIIGHVIVRDPAANEPPQVRTQSRPDGNGRWLTGH